MLKATQIQWDVDCPEELDDLPNEIIIPERIHPDDDDAISDYISEQTGFCHKGFVLENTPEVTL